ncbi:MAG TPA: OPT family oligopeptide transporter [Candidatus Eisenbacteria bacterium]|jgi:uncharacterized oligopeptide transporter (OPT) family protein
MAILAQPVPAAAVAPRKEFTPRAVVASLVIAAVIGASYPYIVLKLGFGPNISVVAAFLGFLSLGIVFRDFSRWENNVIQSAGTAAGQTAFLCVIMAAFDMLRMDPSLGFTFRLTPLQTFLWLSSAGLLGVLLSVPMRQHFVIDEKLPYPDGVAAGETILVLDERGHGSRSATRAMGFGSLASALIMTLREDTRVLANVWYRIPEMLPFGAIGAKMNMGVSWSLLSLGAGMLVGLRVNASMLAGAFISWVIAPPLLLQNGIIQELVRRKVLLWVMWPATGMLVAGGLTALFLRWSMLVTTFKNLAGAEIQAGDFPMKWVLVGSLVCSALVVWVQYTLGMPVWMTLAAILLSLPLMLVGLRVFGETNWGPISAMSNMMQAVFGLLAPGHVMANMVASGVTGTIASESEGLMQVYRTGEMMGSKPRYLTYIQLLAVPVGAATVAVVYPLLRDTYGIGGENGLQSPISQKWAGFATLLSKGLSALPAGAVAALGIAVVLGIAFTVVEGTRWKKFCPSPTGIGIGMLVPGSAIVTMFLGAIVAALWPKPDSPSRDGENRTMTALASGFIAGEAIIAVIVPILVVLHILKLQ